MLSCWLFDDWQKMIKLSVGDPARPDLTEFIKLSIVITLSMFTKDWLVSHKFIPEDSLKT